MTVDLSSLQSAVEALTQSDSDASAELQTLAQQVLALQQTVASGGFVQQSDIDALTATISSANSALEGAVSSAEQTVTPDSPATPIQ